MINVDNWVYSHQTLKSDVNPKEVESDFKRSLKYYNYRIKKYLPEKPDARILDLPCGEGRFLYFLKQQNYKDIKGYDIDESKINIGRLLNLPVIKGDVFENLKNEPDSTLDCIICMDFLEHLEKNLVLELLDLSFRKLTSNGVMLIRMPCADGLFGSRDVCNDFSHKWGATSGVIHRLLSASGFNEISVFGEDPILGRWWDIFRVALSNFLRTIARALFLIMGLPRPVVWSSSMWAFAKKPAKKRD